MTTRREQRLAQTFVTLSDTLVDDFDVLDFLTLLAERATTLLEVTAAGVILSDQRGGWHPTAASTEDAHLLQLLATQTHEGPCQDSITTSAPVTSSDLSTEHARWPTFSEAAVSAGFHTAAAVPMRLRRQTIGALTLLDTTPAAVDTNGVQLGQALADQATVGLLHHRALRREETLSEQLQATLHHRVVIEQAKGILAEAGNLTMQQAFQLLREHARVHDRHLTDLANSLTNRTTQPADLLTARPDPTPHNQE
ncbi:GAF domain-containing protein [Actinopolyspora xinjiangensis]|uniref:GAF domain-containing protein n=1 Tax=Actinopolyspora xinjiangensis TaxID=405564 RepID=A0A1H0W8D5_9ACTN|nr:GAF and ANTAR domain-containing protein [Actinopolyspora xinjiangensis]SDP87010.1 GAF domain-containing protein [Actinopolyspora xinjiangensis]